MNRLLVHLRAFAVPAIAAVTLACGGTPELQVEQKSEPAAPAPAAPEAASPAPATPATMAAHPPMASASAAELPADHPPIGGGAGGGLELVPVPAGSGQGAAAIAWDPPGAWSAETPSSSMRRAQYRVPGPGGDGECAVFYFGPGQGGDPMSNAERWASQFLDAQGQPATASMRTRQATFNGVTVLLVEAAGTYQSGSMMGMGQGTSKPGWALLGAIAQGSDANWFFKLTAPAATVEANRAAFESMIGSLRRGG
jgi:hypothetical protein